jgi:hypothetical protein
MNYSLKEVNRMTPAVAWDIIEKGIKKPRRPRRLAQDNSEPSDAMTVLSSQPDTMLAARAPDEGLSVF